MLDSSSCLAEFSAEVGSITPQQLSDANPGLTVTPWQEYAELRYLRRVPLSRHLMTVMVLQLQQGGAEWTTALALRARVCRGQGRMQPAERIDRHQATAGQADGVGIEGG